MGFGQHPPGFVQVLEHLGRRDCVERSVPERQRFGVGTDNPDPGRGLRILVAFLAATDRTRDSRTSIATTSRPALSANVRESAPWPQPMSRTRVRCA